MSSASDQYGHDCHYGREPDAHPAGIITTSDADDILTAVRYTLHNIMHEIHSGRKIKWGSVSVWGRDGPHVHEWQLSGPIVDCMHEGWRRVEGYRPATLPENWWLCTGPDWSHMRRR